MLFEYFFCNSVKPFCYFSCYVQQPVDCLYCIIKTKIKQKSSFSVSCVTLPVFHYTAVFIVWSPESFLSLYLLAESMLMCDVIKLRARRMMCQKK